MKQVVIRTTADSETVSLVIHGPADQNGVSPVVGTFTLPTTDGATEQVIGLNSGETVVIS